MQFLSALVFLFAFSITTFAQQKVVTLEKAGTLSEQFTEEELNTITDLKVIGEINGADIYFIRSITGLLYAKNITSFDLSEAKIVASNIAYYRIFEHENDPKYFTKDNEIGEKMFESRVKIKSIMLPKNITQIGNKAFMGCSNLETIKLSDNLKVIETMGFYGCDKIDNIIFPKSVKKIDDNAFSSCYNLKNITFLNSVAEFGTNVFSRCGMDKIILPSDMTEVPKRCFPNCSNFKQLEFPQAIKTIKWEAFWGCSNLETVFIPKSLEFIEIGAFTLCDNIKAVYNYNPIPTPLESISYAGDSPFDRSTHEKATLFVPRGSLEAYKNASGWKRFFNIQEFDAPASIAQTNAEEIEAKPIAYYSLDGKQRKEPVKGVNIVKMSDGSVKKIIF